LFEWFVSPSLNNITNVLTKIINNEDNDIIYEKPNYVFIGDAIHSSHYTCENFKIIYQRRRDRLISLIKSSKKIIFCRFEGDVTTKEDIDNFINVIVSINPNLEDVKLFLITFNLELEHPNLVKLIYDHHNANDIWCESEKLIKLFINKLNDIGYNVEDKSDICFTDVSDF
jgi:hypothetical protein